MLKSAITKSVNSMKEIILSSESPKYMIGASALALGFFAGKKLFEVKVDANYYEKMTRITSSNNNTKWK